MYGGLLTTASKRWSDGRHAATPPSTAAAEYRSSSPHSSALRAASAAALALMSIPTQRAAGSLLRSARPMAPVPQPTSRKAAASPCACATSSTSPSVSGRGMSTGGRTSSVRSMKSQSPRMYWTGSRASRRAHMRSKAARDSASSSSSLWIDSAARLVPRPAQRASRCSAESVGSGTPPEAKALVAVCSAAPMVRDELGRRKAEEAVASERRRAKPSEWCAAGGI
mmetsp:Transcript_520/g.1503  ORF Transcript_520/g.1503 Transcript_520/m.1503 type:complete len:225 (+) Transcript_520:423-1097(+)